MSYEGRNGKSMEMDLEKLENKLIQAARHEPENDRVPYAFEKRIMAQLSGSRPQSPLAIWNVALWRAAAACLLVSVLLSFWSANSASFTTASPEPLTLERTVVAMAEELSDNW